VFTGPVFEKRVYHIRLTEGYMPPRGFLASVKAHDNDTRINALLTYELIPDDDDDDEHHHHHHHHHRFYHHA
jgi:hypothetical protein